MFVLSLNNFILFGPPHTKGLMYDAFGSIKLQSITVLEF